MIENWVTTAALLYCSWNFSPACGFRVLNQVLISSNMFTLPGDPWLPHPLAFILINSIYFYFVLLLSVTYLTDHCLISGLEDFCLCFLPRDFPRDMVNFCMFYEVRFQSHPYICEYPFFFFFFGTASSFPVGLFLLHCTILTDSNFKEFKTILLHLSYLFKKFLHLSL